MRPLTPGKFVEVPCPNCEKPVRSYLTNPRKYCSRKCISEYARRDNKCKTCGDEIAVPKSHQRIYCSKKCQGIAMRLDAGTGLRNEALTTYKRHAAERNLAWLLSDEEADRLFAGNCHWCGDAPSNRRFRVRAHGEFIYNGIDRVENAGPYVAANCVSCCFTCNSMKRNFSPQVFLDKAMKIARRHGCASQ